MIFKVFAVFDVKSESYALPHFLPSKGQMIRAFADQINAREGTPEYGMLAKHPQDFILFEIGDYDDSKALLHPYPAPVNIGVGTEFKQS